MTHNVMCAVKDIPPGPCDCGHGPAVDARASELRPAEPVYPEMDALRRAFDRYDRQLPEGTEEVDLLASVALAARVVLATFDRQLAQMAAMRTQHVDDELLRRALAAVSSAGSAASAARTLPCGCGYNAAGAQCCVGIGCDGSHPAHNRGDVEQVEPWHGKATFTGDDIRLHGEVIIGNARPRCSRCYGVGHYASDCTVGL